jgi:hypothetical protein
MPAERTIMRQVREVLRLKFVGGVPTREIARRLGVAASTVRATLKRFEAAGLIWPLPDEMTDAVLEARLFANAGTKQGHRRHTEPDWAALHREMKRKHVTLQILWDEYIEREPQGYRYSRFCELCRGFEATLSVTMRQTHVGGDKLFVDYAGDTVPVIVDSGTGLCTTGSSRLDRSSVRSISQAQYSDFTASGVITNTTVSDCAMSPPSRSSQGSPGLMSRRSMNGSKPASSSPATSSSAKAAASRRE